MLKVRLLVFLLVIAAVVVIAGCSSGKPANNDNGDGGAGGAGPDKAVIFKSQSCGCCDNYVSYMKRQKGFDVSTTNLEDISSVKEKYGVPVSVQSCHTMIVGDYFVEGHVPVEAVKKLLNEKPDIKGIALPGMPDASPGMPGSKRMPFEIYAVSGDGSTSLFMKI